MRLAVVAGRSRNDRSIRGRMHVATHILVFACRWRLPCRALFGRHFGVPSTAKPRKEEREQMEKVLRCPLISLSLIHAPALPRRLQTMAEPKNRPEHIHPRPP